MKDVIISSKGFTINDFYIEGFSLSKGDFISIDFYHACDFKIEKTLYGILSGEKKISEVSVNSQIISVITPIAKSGAMFFSKKTPLKYLEETSHLSNEEIVSLLREMSIDLKSNVYKLGANEKKLLSLEAAYSKSNNIIICTSDLDYSGIERVRSRVQKQVSDGIVIEINYPTSRGREYLFDKSQEYHKKVVLQKV